MTVVQLLNLPPWGELDELYRNGKELFAWKGLNISRYGKIAFPVGTELYHSSHTEDGEQDYSMLHRGSGFFATSTERYADKMGL